MATQVGALPDDALAAVFRALPLRGLAVVRCVCKAWRNVVDARALLPHLHRLQRTMRGVFINYVHHSRPHHFARPCSSSTLPRIHCTLSFLPDDDCRSVLDHCNGLLLCDSERGHGELCVCNPVTRQWTTVVLPRGADGKRHRYAGAYIAFDWAESTHYQVVLIPTVPEAPSPEDRRRAKEERRALLWEKEKDAPFCLDWFFSLPGDGTVVGQWEFQLHEEDLQREIDDQCTAVEGDLQHDIDDPCRLMEWPPASWTLRVFSSRTGRWVERDFVREGMPAGTVEKMRLDLEQPIFYGPRRRYAVYHHGSLYVHCHGSFVARLSLTKSKYQIIEAPANVKNIKPYFGKLHNGVCFGTIQDHQLRIWILNESCDHMEWILKYEAVVGHYAEYLENSYYSGRELEGSWIVEENIDIQDTGHDVESLSKESHEWDSDNDDTVTINAKSQEDFDYHQHLDVIGFHPYKDIVFMVQRFQVVAYHLNSTKIQYLGNSYPKCYNRAMWNGIYESFLYTPCMSMTGDMLHREQTSGQSSSED